MGYFKNAKVGDKVYGLIFGKGKISECYDDSHYVIMVDFANGYEVPYTVDGIPSWGNFSKQTCFYRDDVNLTKVDFSPVEKILNNKKIIKLREQNMLEVRMPSGIWKNVDKCPESYIEKICENEKYHLFRKKSKK
ncbi:MAG: hypothetical protein U9Q29_04115 [Campylobacterota bacterium]|nr:hypothetical protein [Campylobacterota bacterium]